MLQISLQVVNLHYMLSKAVVKARPSVLWCYKKELFLSRCRYITHMLFLGVLASDCGFRAQEQFLATML